MVTKSSTWPSPPAFASDRSAFAGTGQGLLRTTDRGETWLRLYGGLPDSTAHDPRGIDDIARVRLSPDFGSDGIVLGSSSSEGALYLSTDRGDAWTRALTGTVTAAAFARDFGTDHALFAARFDGASTTHLLRSTDGGQSWALVLHPSRPPGG